MAESELERRETERAAAEAAKIGGSPGEEPIASDETGEAERPLVEAGEGEAEGLESADAALIDHASHGDQHAARRAIEDAPDQIEDERAERHEDDRPADR